MSPNPAHRISTPSAVHNFPASLPTKTQIAYLGPEGTYGQQAALALSRYLPDPELIPCPNITSIYKNSATYLVMPLENTLQGGVNETLDCLLSCLRPEHLAGTSTNAKSMYRGKGKGNEHGHRNGNGSGDKLSGGDGIGNGNGNGNGSEEENGNMDGDGEENLNIAGPSTPHPEIIGETTLPISHSLVVRKGVKMEDIRWVRSHEQALGQSRNFLRQYLPWAELQSYPSTAGAALSLLSDSEPDGGSDPDPPLTSSSRVNPTSRKGEGAAICSKAVLNLPQAEELEVLYQGTQDISENYTRFLILSRHPTSPPPSLGQVQVSERTTFYALSDSRQLGTLAQHQRDRQSILHADRPILDEEDELSEFSELRSSSDRSDTIVRVHTRPAPPGVGKGRFPSWLLVETAEKAGGVGSGGGVRLGQCRFSIPVDG